MPDLDGLALQFQNTLAAAGRTDRTIENYLYALRGFARFLQPRTVTDAVCDDIVAYQRQLGGRGLSDSSVRVATYALRFFYREVLEHRDWNYARVPPPRRPHRLPEVLDPAEVEAILDAAPNLKYRVVFMTIYGSGLRTEETLRLEPAHIDAARNVLRVSMGKGRQGPLGRACPWLLSCTPHRARHDNLAPSSPLNPVAALGSADTRSLLAPHQRASSCSHTLPPSTRPPFQAARVTPRVPDNCGLTATQPQASRSNDT